MRAAVVFPFHDSDGTTFAQLNIILPSLKSVFTGAYLGVTPLTYERCRKQIRALQGDLFFSLFALPPGAALGEQFLYLYGQAACAAYPTQVLHLCFFDRLSSILQSRHQGRFVEDVSSIEPNDTPLIFSRSATAWASHPRNYSEIEQFATTAGQWLFGKRLDFAWCHLAICASQLAEIVARIHHGDLSMLAEITLAIREGVTMRDVDWLEWEDPFHLKRLPVDLKIERESCVAETEKRLAYVLPMIQALLTTARE